jgi:hypothetical protein
VGTSTVAPRAAVRPPEGPPPAADHPVETPRPPKTDENRLDGAEHALELLGEYMGLRGRLAKEASARSRLDLLRREADAKGVSVEFLIATLPDYVDSNSAWMFDPSLDALQRAAGVTGYVVERFHLPDRDGAGETRGATPLAHEVEPAAVLFRRINDPRQLLMILVPLETATAGVHRQALLSALALASGWGPPDVLRILGPTFSGSTPSLRRFLQAAVDEGLLGRGLPGVTDVRIISGSATSLRNLQLQGSYEGPGRRIEVTFRAVTVNDDATQVELSRYLGGLRRKWAEGEGIALVVESNTSWGGSLLGPDRLKPGLPKPRAAFPKAERLTFPLHVSRLRALSAREKTPGTDDGGDAKPSPLLDDASPPADLLPPLTPELTARTVQVALDNMLDGIERLNIEAVGLFGTDARDRLFLAELISRRFPNVLLFSLEGNLIYLDRDYRSFARGMVVASTYPLFVLTQPGSPEPAGPLQQFASMGMQGTYNAFLALLDRPQHMLDYGDDCASRACGPSVWISLVGQESIWPLRRSAMVVDRYSWVRRVEAGAGEAGTPGPVRPARLAWPVSAILISALLVVVVLLHAALTGGLFATEREWERETAVANRRSLKAKLASKLAPLVRSSIALAEAPDRCGRRADPKRSEEADEKARAKSLREEWFMAVLACWGPLGVASIWALAVAIAGPGPGAPWRADAILWVAVAWLVLGTLGGLATLRAVWPGADELRNREILVAWFVRLLSVGFVLAIQWFLFRAMTGPFLTGELAPYNVARATRAETFASPSIPILLLAATTYLWGLLNLWRLHQQASGFPASSPISEVLDRPAWGKPGDTAWGAGAELTTALNNPILWLRAAPALVVMLVFSVQLVGVYRYGNAPDGRDLSWVLCLGTLLSQFLIGHALTYSVALARTLLRALRALSLHPLASAFTTIGGQPFLWRLSLGAPTGGDLAPLIHQTNAVSAALKRKFMDMPDWPPELELFPRSKEEDRLPFHATRPWRSLLQPGVSLVAGLRQGPWSEKPCVDPKMDRPSPWREAESFVALQVAYVIKHALVRITRGLAFVIAGLLLVMAAHLFYTFQGRGFWLALDWSLLGLSVAVAVALMLAFEKDPILSRLWGSEPGQIGFRSEFVQRILLYAALPVVTLFTTFFPELAASLFSWLEPVRRSLP